MKFGGNKLKVISTTDESALNYINGKLDSYKRCIQITFCPREQEILQGNELKSYESPFNDRVVSFA